MIFNPAKIDGVWRIGIERQSDARGSFGRVFCHAEFARHGLAAEFVQASSSVTRRAGTIRAMHYQNPPHAEAKLIRCLRGAVHDIVADIRPESPSFMQWEAFHLEAGDDQSLYIPAGCAHGFQTLADDTEIFYQMSVAFAPGYAGGFRYDDPVFAISWPCEVSVIAEKDLAWPIFDPRRAAVTLTST